MLAPSTEMLEIRGATEAASWCARPERAGTVACDTWPAPKRRNRRPKPVVALAFKPEGLAAVARDSRSLSAAEAASVDRGDPFWRGPKPVPSGVR